jgi:hypothetical protein
MSKLSQKGDPIYTDTAYGSLFQKRRGTTWWARYSFRCPAFVKGSGPDGDKFGDWTKVGETLGPDRALASGRLVPWKGEGAV